MGRKCCEDTRDASVCGDRSLPRGATSPRPERHWRPQQQSGSCPFAGRVSADLQPLGCGPGRDRSAQEEQAATCRDLASLVDRGRPRSPLAGFDVFPKGCVQSSSSRGFRSPECQQLEVCPPGRRSCVSFWQEQSLLASRAQDHPLRPLLRGPGSPGQMFADLEAGVARFRERPEQALAP